MSCNSRPIGAIAVALAAMAGDVRGGGLCFTRRVIATDNIGVRGCTAVDLDLDGDTDLITAATDAWRILWYENDGALTPSFAEHVIDPDFQRPNHVVVEDLDGDGDRDLVVSGTTSSLVAWFESDGGSPPSFVRRVISSAEPGARKVFAADVDGDGDVDTGSAAVFLDTVAWHEQDGGDPPAWTKRLISQTVDGARAIAAGDLDGDDDIDIAAGPWYGESIVWYENDGNATPAFTEHVVATYTAPPGGDPNVIGLVWDLLAVDVNDDGDLDLLAARIPGIELLDNDGGSPPTFTLHVLAGSNLAWGARMVRAADMDLDGDLDPVYVTFELDKVAWLENLGGRSPVFIDHAVEKDPDGIEGPDQGHADGARCVDVGDIDGDGDVDILWGSKVSHVVAWEENHLIDSEPACPADLDGNGVVASTDLIILLFSWHSDFDCPPDLNGDGIVGGPDLQMLFESWGPCP